MRRPDELQDVLGLIEKGLNNCEIARRTGVSLTTIRRWRGSGAPSRLLGALNGSLCERCRQACLPLADDQHAAYAYLLGQYLGDGTITRHRRDVFRLLVYGDARQSEIAAEVEAAMRTVMPGRAVCRQRHGSDNCIATSMYSRSWPCLFPQTGPGMKHTRTITLADWQQAITTRFPQQLLRGLIHSDGCRNDNLVRAKGKTYSYPRYQFSNRSDDIRRIFCDHLDLLGIPWRRMNRWNISVARREGVARLDEFVGPKK